MFKYAHPTDNYTASGTATPSTEDTVYPFTNAYDNRPSKPFRFTATTGNIVWDLGAAVQIDAVAVIRHNLQDSLPGVAIQANSGNTWASPPLNEAITVYPADLDGHTRNLFKDLTNISTRSYRYWRLIVASANDVNVSMGEIFLTKLRTLPNDVDWPVGDRFEQPLIEHQTDFLGTMNYDLGVKRRNFSGTTKVTVSGRAVIKQYWDACHGRSKPHLIVPFPEDDEAFMVRFMNVERDDQRTFLGHITIDLAWQEVSSGLRARN